MDYTKQNLCADACSLIYLYRCDILRYAARCFCLWITPEILQELSVKASGKELQAYYSMACVKNVTQHLAIRGLTANDRGLIALFHQENYDAILSEDGKILHYCKNNHIQHFCSLSLVCELVKKRELSQEQAHIRFESLKECGRYAPWVIEQAYSILASIKL